MKIEEIDDDEIQVKVEQDVIKNLKLNNSQPKQTSLIIESDDIIIWPLNKVQQNFVDFIQKIDKWQSKNQITNSENEELLNTTKLQTLFKESIEKQKHISEKKNKKQWKENERILLKQIILYFCLLNDIHSENLVNTLSQEFYQQDDDWRAISKLTIGRNATQCKYKWLSKSKCKLMGMPWTKEEDQTLEQIYHSNIANLKKIALRCRTKYVRQGKQCRERWINKLDPNIEKGSWTKQEEYKLMIQILEQGKKWSDIVRKNKWTRTENALKNRFHTLLKKERNRCGSDLVQLTQDQITELINQINIKKLKKTSHLYEDVDQMELQLLIRIIQRFQAEQIDEESNDFDLNNEQQDEKKEKRDSLIVNDKVINLNISNPGNVNIEQIQKQLQQNTIQSTQFLNKIQQTIDNENQEVNQETIDKSFSQLVSQFSESNKLELEQIFSLQDIDLQNCCFAVRKFNQSSLSVFPKEQFKAILNNLQFQQPLDENILFNNYSDNSYSPQLRAQQVQIQNIEPLRIKQMNKITFRQQQIKEQERNILQQDHQQQVAHLPQVSQSELKQNDNFQQYSGNHQRLLNNPQNMFGLQQQVQNNEKQVVTYVPMISAQDNKPYMMPMMIPYEVLLKYYMANQQKMPNQQFKFPEYNQWVRKQQEDDQEMALKQENIKKEENR